MERINASANTYESEDYIHLWEFDTDMGDAVPLFRDRQDKRGESVAGGRHTGSRGGRLGQNLQRYRNQRPTPLTGGRIICLLSSQSATSTILMPSY